MVWPFPLFGHVYKLNGLQAEQEELKYYGLDWSIVVIGHPLVVAYDLVPKLSDKCLVQACSLSPREFCF